MSYAPQILKYERKNAILFVLYRLNLEVRCLRKHCNPSGPVECGILSAAMALSTGPEGQCHVDTELPRLTGLDLRICLVA